MPGRMQVCQTVELQVEFFWGEGGKDVMILTGPIAEDVVNVGKEPFGPMHGYVYGAAEGEI